MRHHGCMKAYSEDLPRKVVEAVEHRGMGKSQAARSFGVSLSSVKRYVGRARQGSSLSPRKHPGPRPKTERRANHEVAGSRRRRTPGVFLKRAGAFSRASGGG